MPECPLRPICNFYGHVGAFKERIIELEKELKELQEKYPAVKPISDYKPTDKENKK